MGFIQNIRSNHNTTRRGFLQSALAAGIALTSCKKKKSRPTMPPLPSKALTILQGARLSSRYQDFSKTASSLIKKGKIKFKESNTLEKYQSYAIYNSKTNTIVVDKSWISTDNKESKATVIHELFHAYQDYQKRYLTESAREAEALLAEYDYLYQQNENLPEAWFVIHRLPSAKTEYAFRFNVPRSVIQSCANTDFASASYRKAVDKIAQNKLWAKYSGFQRILSEPLVNEMKKSRKSLREINKLWETLGKRLSSLPKSSKRTALINESVRTIGKKSLPDQIKISMFIAASQLLVQKYLNAGRVDYAQTVYNQTFKAFKYILGPANLSPFDVAYQFDGID